MINALSLCIVFATFASIFSITCSYTFQPTMFVILLWLFFFFGAGTMPIANGIILGCVPKSAQNSASALFFVLQNLLGYAMAPVLACYMIEQY